MRSYMGTDNLICVSANVREGAINTPATLDTTLLCDIGDVINLDPRRVPNENEATGKEEVDRIDDLGSLSSWSPKFEKAQPQHLAFLWGYGLGVSTPAAAGAGYKHTGTPIDGDLDSARSDPSFTAAQRYGDTVLRRRYSSLFVDSFTTKFERDKWVSIAGKCKGTGKVDTNVTEEVINAYADAVSLSLAANAVQGSDAATRLANVQRIRVELADGVWTEVAYSAVSADTPAAITITSAGGGHVLKNYRVLYIPAESGWMTFPARVNETPLRVSEMTLKVGGAWSGSAFVGGRSIQSELKSLEWSFNKNMAIQFVPGAGGAYASSGLRGGRVQVIKLNREFREFILQQHLVANDTLGLYVLAEGALYDATYKYQAEAIFPKVGVLSAPISVDGKRLAEAGDLQVLQHDTYGSVITTVQNLQTKYAAAA
jgi:hypothetical protein